MSLINDALKRAKATQAQVPALAPPLPLRPVEPAVRARRGVGLLVPLGLGLIAVVGLFWLWQLSRHHSAPDPGPLRITRTSPNRAPDQANPATIQAAITTSPADIPAPAAPATLTVTTVVVAAASPPAAQATAPTNLPAPPEPPAPKPPPLKLQAIFLDPAKPSAMISGKTVFVGSRLREFQVMAITSQSATLVANGHTNVLSMDQ